MDSSSMTIATEKHRTRVKEAIDEAPLGHHVVIKPPNRTLDQNALLWELLNQVARRVEWYGRYLRADDWKHIFTASLKQQTAVPGIEQGSMVVLGLSTSKMTKKQFSDLVEIIYAFCAERGVDLEQAPYKYLPGRFDDERVD